MMDHARANAARYAELKFNSDPANLAMARRAIEAFCGASGFSENTCGQIMICLNEALTNIMRHAYKGATDRPIELKIDIADDALRIRVRDWGSGVNPLELPQRKHDLRRPGGLGLVCMRQLMDEILFESQDDGMMLTMSRRRSDQREQGSSDRAVG